MKDLGLRTFITLFVLSALIYFLDGRQIFDPVKSLLQIVTTPVQYGVYSTAQAGSELFSFITFWRSGEARIRNLEQRNLELLANHNRAEVLERENTDLRAQLGAKTSVDRQLLPATVLGVGRYLEIGIGVGQGISEGQTVVYLNNLIGKIVKVTTRVSYVQLITDPQAKVPVKVGKARGLVTGQYNSSLILDRIAQTEDIADNSLILTSGESESFVPDLVVGKVSKVISSETDVFKKAEVQPIVKLNDLSLVFVCVTM